MASPYPGKTIWCHRWQPSEATIGRLPKTTYTGKIPNPPCKVSTRTRRRSSPGPGVDLGEPVPDYGGVGMTINKLWYDGGEGPGDDSSPLRTPMQRTNSWRSRVPLLNECACVTERMAGEAGCPYQTNVSTAYLMLWYGAIEHPRTISA